MTKIIVGFDNKKWGVIEFVSGKSIMLEGNKKLLNRIVDSMQGQLSDEEFVKTLPNRFTGRMWAETITDSKMEREQQEKAHIDLDALAHISEQNNDFFFMLKLGDIPTIKRWQSHAREVLKEDGIEWSDPENFHITLVFVPSISAATTLQLTMGVDIAKTIPLIIDGFGTFSKERGDESNVLYLVIEKTEELAPIQRQLYDFVLSKDMTTSPFSIPEDWTPHITLAVSEKPFNEATFPSVGGFAVEADDIEASVSFETIAISEKFNPYHVPAGSPEGGQFTTSPEGSGSISFNKDVADAIKFEDGEREEIVFGGAHYTFKLTVDEEEFFVKHLGPGDEGEEILHKEIAAVQIAKVMGLENEVLDTWDVSDDDVHFMATEWVDGNAWAMITDDERAIIIANLSDDKLTRMILFDYIIGNTDRNPGNTMVSNSGNLVLIDHEFSLEYGTSRTSSFQSAESLLYGNVPGDRSMSVSAIQDIVNSKDAVQSILSVYDEENVNPSFVLSRIDSLNVLLESDADTSFGAMTSLRVSR